VERQVRRPWLDRIQRGLLRAILPYPKRFAPLARLGRFLRPLAPSVLRKKIPAATCVPTRPQSSHPRKMLLLEGCVQPSLAPSINAAAARVFDRLGISLIRAEGAGCCGALSYHLSAHEEGKGFMRRNIDAWWSYLDEGVETIVMTATGCGLMVKEYGEVLKHDSVYADKAARIAAMTKDLVEVLAGEDLSTFEPNVSRKLAFHSPCTLQHGQKLNGMVERLLSGLGFELTPVADPHLCCGSAGTYSLLQPDISDRLLAKKVATLEAGHPDVIATANIGCLTHIQSGTEVPVRHWIELLDPRTAAEGY